MPDQFDALSMKEFNQLLDGYETRIKERDFNKSYFTALMLTPYGGEEFDLAKACNNIYQCLHPTQTSEEQMKQEKEDLRKTFNL